MITQIQSHQQVEKKQVPREIGSPEGFQLKNPKPKQSIDRVVGAGTRATQSERQLEGGGR